MANREEELGILDSLASGAGNALGGRYVSGALNAGKDALQGNVKSFGDLGNSYDSGRDAYDKYSQQARKQHPYAEVVGGNIPGAVMTGTAAAGGIKDALRGLLNTSKTAAPAMESRVAQTVAKEAPEAALSLDEIMAKVKSGGTANPEANALSGAMNTYRDNKLYKDEASRIADWIGSDKGKIEKTLEAGAGTVDPAEETLRKLMSLGK